MIYAKLFLVFLKIGAVSFGGGYGMISLIRESVLEYGWLTEEKFLDFIAVSESTPGPLAVNMATFIGASQAGIGGALVATLGVVLPSFAVLLVVSAVLGNILKYGGVKAVLGGIRPAVTAMILSTAVLMAAPLFFGADSVYGEFSFKLKNVAVFAAVAALWLFFKIVLRRNIPPVLLIIFSAAAGIAVYSL